MKVDLNLSKNNRGWLKSLAILLTALTTAVLFGWVFIPGIISWQILKRTGISPDINPEMYSAWLHPPVPVYLKVYLFNCTNPSQVEKGSLPAIQEMGPYIFQEIRQKVQVTFDDPTDTATYLEHITYHFDKELSGSVYSLDDVITLINVPFAGAAIQIDRDVPWPLSHVAKTILLNYKEPLFVQKTVDEVLFKGWKVPFLEKIEEELGLKLLENNTFSLFAGYNDTMQGPYTIRRGLVGDKSLYGTYVRYKNESSLKFWGNDPNSPCNQIYGSDGSLYPPFVDKKMKMKMFNAEICRSAYLVYRETINFKGIQAYRFAPTENMTEEEVKNEQCFCLEEDPDKCLKQGAADMGPCKDGAPVAMSTPHFYGNADPGYLEMKEGGWKPEREKHETFIDIEPLTGAVIQAHKKLQVNLILKPVKSIKSMKKLKSILFPLFWGDECAALDTPTSEWLKSILFQIHAIEYSSKLVAILIALIVPMIILRRNRSRNPDNLVNKSDKELADSHVRKNEELSSSRLLIADAK